MDMQFCPECKRDLPLESYIPSKRGKKGNMCRKCNAAYSLAYYHRNKDKIQQQRKARYDADPERHRQYVYDWVKRNPEYQKQWQRQNPDKVRAYYLKYKAAHPEVIQAYREARKEWHRVYSAEHYRRNFAHRQAWGQQYYQANKERIRERRRKFYEANKEKFQAQGRAYRRLNRVKLREKTMRYKARKQAATIGPVELDRILARDGWVCHICGELVAPGELSFDHIVPLAKGGAHTESNLAVAHKACNSRKRDRLDVPSVAPPRIRKSQQR